MRRLHRQLTPRTRWAALVLLVLAIACDDDAPPPPLAPPPVPTTFYPLSVGATWTYASSRVVRFIAEDGGDARPPIDLRAAVTHEIVAEEVIAGKLWAVEEERFIAEGSADTVRSWRRYREDTTGLYRADLSIRLAPGGAAALDTLTAARRLAYPREPGSIWLLHDGDPGATGMLAAIDTLATGVGTLTAFVVSYRQPGDGTDDRRLYAYSACGLIRSELHSEVAAIDAGTGERVLIVSTETAELIAVSPGCPALLPPGR